MAKGELPNHYVLAPLQVKSTLLKDAERASDHMLPAAAELPFTVPAYAVLILACYLLN